MLDLSKPLQTVGGREVKIFTTEARDTDFPIQGEIYNGKWLQSTWTKDGYFGDSAHNTLNLVNIETASSILERMLRELKPGDAVIVDGKSVHPNWRGKEIPIFERRGERVCAMFPFPENSGAFLFEGSGNHTCVTNKAFIRPVDWTPELETRLQNEVEG